MPVLTALYVDFQDPASHRAWNWLSFLPERQQVDVRPFLLDSVNAGPLSPWESTSPSWALELLAMGECARDAGAAVQRRFVDAAFEAVHRHGTDPAAPETWLRLGTELGLDLDGYTAEGDRWRAEVGLWHREAADELGVTGVPTLVFDDRHALRLVLDQDLVDAAAARRLLATLAELAGQPVAEIRRAR